MALALAGCATPYQKETRLEGGYGELQVGETQYYVYFADSGYSGVDRDRAFWLYRCAELTVEKGFRLMFLKPDDGTSPRGEIPYASAGAGARPSFAVWNPEARAEVLRVGGAPPLPPLFLFPPVYPPSPVTPYKFGGTMWMYRQSLPEEITYALDARKVMERLAPYVESDGRGAYPDIQGISIDALVAHETVTLSLELSQVQQPAVAAPDPRDPHETRARLDSLDLRLALHSLYRERARASGLAESGSVTLALRVIPNGSVSACIVVATSLSDAELVESVRRLVSEIRFDEKEVSTLDVTSFAIVFSPRAPELQL